MRVAHVIFGTYGFWLPNDPRGSWSDFVAAWDLFRTAGPATTVNTRRSLAARKHDQAARLAAKKELKYPPVILNGLQARTVGEAFYDFATRSRLTILGCAILPQHIHLVVADHRYDAGQIVTLLKGSASKHLEEQSLHPMSAFPRRKGRLAKCWARGEWKVYLDTPTDLKRAIRYVESNPVKEGLKPQRWRVVTPLDHWLNPKSPPR
jgi:REP element-mobilizing transposase RayT